MISWEKASKKAYKTSMKLYGYVHETNLSQDRNARIEKLWHKIFRNVCYSFGFNKANAEFLWENLMCGNWERLHLFEDEVEYDSSKWLEKFLSDVYYCSDRWSMDRLCRCHWYFRQWKKLLIKE